VSESFPIALDALAYAARMHAGQRRRADGAPFILHLLEVAGLLYRSGAPDHVIATGVLHDIIEKTSFSPDSLATSTPQAFLVASQSAPLTGRRSRTLRSGAGVRVACSAHIRQVGAENWP
jgi:hypothetical protein